MGHDQAEWVTDAHETPFTRVLVAFPEIGPLRTLIVVITAITRLEYRLRLGPTNGAHMDPLQIPVQARLCYSRHP